MVDLGRNGVKAALLLVAYANVASCFSSNVPSIRSAGRGTASSAFPASSGPRLRRLGPGLTMAEGPGDLVETIGGFALQVSCPSPSISRGWVICGVACAGIMRLTNQSVCWCGGLVGSIKNMVCHWWPTVVSSSIRLSHHLPKL